MFAVYAKCPSRWRRGFGYNLNSHVVHKKGGGGGSYCATWGEGLDVKSCFDAFH